MFLASLHPSLDEVNGKIIDWNPLPSIKEVFLEVRHEDFRCKIMLKNLESSSFLKFESSAIMSNGLILKEK